MISNRRLIKIRRSAIPAAIAGAAGTGVGLVAARLAASSTSQAVAVLTDALTKHVALSTAGPIIATGMIGASVILAAAVIPVAAVWAITRKEHPHDKAKPPED